MGDGKAGDDVPSKEPIHTNPHWCVAIGGWTTTGELAGVTLQQWGEPWMSNLGLWKHECTTKNAFNVVVVLAQPTQLSEFWFGLHETL